MEKFAEKIIGLLAEMAHNHYEKSCANFPFIILSGIT
jgi:hypothetical protein